MLRQYREYILLLIKCISWSVLIYTCFYAGAFFLFSIYLPGAFLYTGISTIVISMALYLLANKRYKKQWEMVPVIIMGAVYSVLPSVLYMLSGYDIILTVLCFLFNTFLWKLGWDISVCGIDYELYKDDFKRDFVLLIVIILLSMLSGDSTFMTITGRFTILYIIMGPMLLKNSRDMELVTTGISKKTERANILSNILMLLLMIFASSEMFISYILIALKAVYNIISNLLEPFIWILGYIVTFVMSPIIKLLKSKINANNFVELSETKGALPEATDPYVLPYGVSVAIKLMILVLIVFILIRICNKVYKSKKKNDEFTESREFVLDAAEAGKNIKAKLSSLLSRLYPRRKPSQNDLRGRIRYLYYSFLEISIKLENYKKIHETPIDIGKNTENKLKEPLPSLEYLTKAYQQARYSQSEPTIEEYKQTEMMFKEVKDKLLDK